MPQKEEIIARLIEIYGRDASTFARLALKASRARIYARRLRPQRHGGKQFRRFRKWVHAAEGYERQIERLDRRHYPEGYPA